jgi:hypothetical protein
MPSTRQAVAVSAFLQRLACVTNQLQRVVLNACPSRSWLLGGRGQWFGTMAPVAHAAPKKRRLTVSSAASSPGH